LDEGTSFDTLELIREQLTRPECKRLSDFMAHATSVSGV